MKRHLAPALFVFSLCAVLGGAREAGAQHVEAFVVVTADSALFVEEEPALEPRAMMLVTKPEIRGGPVIMAPFPILLRDARQPAELQPAVTASAVADWRMPASRTMIIGGAAAAIIGLAVVGGDAGAIVAMGGTGVALYGLYLHYNR